MATWDSYTQKNTPSDNDTLMIKDTDGGVNKRTPFSGVWDWIVGKLTSAVISNLKTTNKSIIPAINELDSGKMSSQMVVFSDGVDLDTIKDVGFYSINKNNSENLPLSYSDAIWMNLIVLNTGGNPNYPMQILIPSSSGDAPDIFIRSSLNGKWAKWYCNAAAPSNAGAHNSIYRGKNLGSSVTEAQWSAIQAGTFDDLFIGDYWTINGTVYRIAGFNLIKNCGDNVSIGNNMCLVPDSALYNAQMHNTDSGEYESGSDANDTTGAYVNSDMRTTNLTQATNKIITDFGSSHVISYRDILPNATANGQSSGWEWYDCKVELMSEVMVYGTKVWGNNIYEVGCLNEQFPLFRLNPESIHRRFNYWLRSVGSATLFARVGANGSAGSDNASYACGVRPFFFVN